MDEVPNNFRVGFGTDRHRLIPGGGLLIGGVKVDCSFAARAHSDGDVLLHALTDAILGALGAGDIGALFSDTAAENAGRDSGDFVLAATRLMHEAGYALVNVDAVVQLETPKLSPHKAAMRSVIAELCACDAVSVKAKTGEGIGAVGMSEAIDAQVVVLLQRTGAEGAT